MIKEGNAVNTARIIKPLFSEHVIIPSKRREHNEPAKYLQHKGDHFIY